MALADIVGGIATLCSISSFVPQAWKIIRTRDTSGISTRMYVLTVVGFSLWLTYGILLGSVPLMAANGVCLALSAFILVMKMLPKQKKEAVAGTLGVAPAPEGQSSSTTASAA
ncbi:MAG TPA: SemiSWEET transporter [Roseococcus sp.]|jgi:MtN3 and saliva related transmembrane protein|nr:SemiSWEET transporter [Roseococcus sp.]